MATQLRGLDLGPGLFDLDLGACLDLLDLELDRSLEMVANRRSRPLGLVLSLSLLSLGAQ